MKRRNFVIFCCEFLSLFDIVILLLINIEGLPNFLIYNYILLTNFELLSLLDNDIQESFNTWRPLHTDQLTEPQQVVRAAAQPQVIHSHLLSLNTFAQQDITCFLSSGTVSNKSFNSWSMRSKASLRATVLNSTTGSAFEFCCSVYKETDQHSWLWSQQEKHIHQFSHID